MERFEALFLQNLIRGRADGRFMDVAEEDVELVGVGDEDAVQKGWMEHVPEGTAGSSVLASYVSWHACF